MKVLNPTSLKNQLEKTFKAHSNCHVIITNFKHDRQIDIIKNKDDYIYHEKGFQNLRKKNLTKGKLINLIQKQLLVEFANSKKLHYQLK